jgi:hypothetical protein
MRKTTVLTLVFVSFYNIAQAQKGEKTIAAGPLISFPLPTETVTGRSDLKTGIGLEAIGQYNVSKKSALVLKATLSSWRYRSNLISYERNRLNFFTVQGGYNYQFHPSGLFLNGLVGSDFELYDGFSTVSFTLGLGKRFRVREIYFIDAGIDLVGGDAESRVNIKALFSIFRWQKEN